MISRQDTQTFRNEGFVIKRGLLAQQARYIAVWTDEIARWPELAGKYMMYFEQSLRQPSERLLSRVENFCPYHAGFHKLLTETVLDGAASLFGEAVVLFKDKINFKLPGAGGFTAHQDVQAGWDKYASLHITAMITIDAATPENGCLEIVSGHHRRGLIGRMFEPLDDVDVTGMAFLPCVTRPGDVVFFDSFTPHRSSPNRSTEPRRVLYITYNRRAEGDHRLQYYADKRHSYPPDCERQPGRQYRFRV
jgi:hypothetical protein